MKKKSSSQLSTSPPPFNPYKHQHHFVRHVVTAIILVILSFIGGLYFAGAGLFSPFGGSVVDFDSSGSDLDVEGIKEASYEEGYQAAVDFARDRFVAEGLVEGKGEINHLEAKVKSVSGQNIVVEFKASVLDLLQEGMSTKTVTVSDDVIELRTLKPEEQREKEYEEYEKAMNEGLTGLEEPLDYTVQYIKVADLKEGDKLDIITDADIRTTDSFEAKAVELLKSDEILDENSPEPTGEEFRSSDELTPRVDSDEIIPPEYGDSVERAPEGFGSEGVGGGPR